MHMLPAELSSLNAVPLAERSLVLVGLMGAGKSRIGREVAAHLGWCFADSDAVIEQEVGRSVRDIFATEGEAAFRQREREGVARLLTDGTRRVVATGGGAFVQTECREMILTHGVALWLRARVETLVARTAGDISRPLLAGGDPRAVLEKLAHTRSPFYALAPLVVETDDLSPAEVVERVITAWRAHVLRTQGEGICNAHTR